MQMKGQNFQNPSQTIVDNNRAASGASTRYQRIVAGVLAATLAFGTLPMQAFAQGADNGNESAPVEQVVDQKALDQIKYKADFKMSDIALPKGIVATKEGLKATKAAAPELSAALADGGGFINWDNSSTAVDYVVGKLGYVDESAAKVGKLGKSLFDVIKGGATGDLEGVLSGCRAFLQLTGAVEAEDEGPTNADLMNEIKDLNTLLQGMCDQLDANTKQTYQNRLTVFDNAIGGLNMECGRVETMIQKAYEIAESKGLLNQKEPEKPTLTELPAEPAAPEMPSEPTAPELPAEPTLELSEEPKHPSNFYPNDERWDFMADDWYRRYGIDQMHYTIDYQCRVSMWKQAHAAWEAECDGLRADYEKAHADWQAECDRLNADFEKAHADWQAECDRLNAEHEKAHTDWQAECERIKADNEKLEADYKAAHAEWKKDSNISRVITKVMRDENAAGNTDFQDYSSFMTSIRQNFETVATECAKKGGASPFHAFDSYWALHFNFDTQGYYLRQAYRTAAEYQLKRAYSLMGIYFDIPTAVEESIKKNNGENKEPYTVALQAALKGIEALPAGTSPEDVRGETSASGLHLYYKAPVHSYTLNRDFKRSLCLWSLASVGDGNHFTDKEIAAYCKRLHGRTVAEDLKLAGIMHEDIEGWNAFFVSHNHKERVSRESYVGLGVRHKVEKGTWNTYYLPFDATDNDLKKFDEDPRTHQVLFLSPEGKI